MGTGIAAKLDKIILLLEAEDQPLQRPCSKNLIRDVLFQMILASTTGYFMFRILDHHFGGRRKAR